MKKLLLSILCAGLIGCASHQPHDFIRGWYPSDSIGKTSMYVDGIIIGGGIVWLLSTVIYDSIPNYETTGETEDDNERKKESDNKPKDLR